MAISGKCYLSLQNMGRSANRGECMQLCRRGYTVRDRETGTELDIDNKYIMSPRDLKTIRFIDRMMQSGVRVFKSEGRARGAEYVSTVVRCYSEAIQAVLANEIAAGHYRLKDMAILYHSGANFGYKGVTFTDELGKRTFTVSGARLAAEGFSGKLPHRSGVIWFYTKS